MDEFRAQSIPVADQSNINELLAECIKNPEVHSVIRRFRGDIITKLEETLFSVTVEPEFKYVNAQLYIEEQNTSREPVIFRCSPEWKLILVKDEIKKMFAQFSLKSMNIVYGHSIANDTLRLKDVGVTDDDDYLCVFIYEKENMKKIKNIGHMFETDNNMETQPLRTYQVSNINPSVKVKNVGVQDKHMTDGNDPINTASTSGVFKSLPERQLQLQPNLSQNVTNKWQCPNCTYLNELNRPGCEICSYDNPNNIVNEMDIEETIKEDSVGWKCPSCTFINEPTRPGCEQCSEPVPLNYKIPEDYVPSIVEKERLQKEKEIEEQAEREKTEERERNYQNLVTAEEQSIVMSTVPVECLICLTESDPEDTVVLKECLHRFCKECLIHHINSSEDGMVKCPFVDDDYSCDKTLTEREIKALLKQEDFDKFLSRGLSLAEAAIENTFHCKTPDCQGWCEYDDQVNTFPCPICKKNNCLTCKAIHENLNCKQYQEKIELESTKDKNALKTKQVLESMVKKGDAMHCPRCNIILMKKKGCDWLRCTMCKLEICWVTKGARWGPNGTGDTSGGCKCRVNNKKCHKNCINCH